MTHQRNNLSSTVTIGGDLTGGRIGYGAMQLTGPKVWGEYPDHDKGVDLLRKLSAKRSDSNTKPTRYASSEDPKRRADIARPLASRRHGVPPGAAEGSGTRNRDSG